MFDSLDNPKDRFLPTILDNIRLEDMDVGEIVDFENGEVRVFRYKENYCFLLLNEPKFQGMPEVSNLKKLKAKLKELNNAFGEKG